MTQETKTQNKKTREEIIMEEKNKRVGEIKTSETNKRSAKDEIKDEIKAFSDAIKEALNIDAYEDPILWPLLRFTYYRNTKPESLVESLNIRRQEIKKAEKENRRKALAL